MKRVTQKLVLLLILLMGVTTVNAQLIGNRGQAKDLMGIEVHFRFDKADLDLGYMGNEKAFARFAHVIDSIGIQMVDSVVIVSQSSPEGVYEHNLKLSQRRAATMHTAIDQRYPELGNRLHVHPDGESWLQLREYVKKDKLMKQATIDKVVSIIDSDVNIGTKKWRLEQLPIYRYLRMTYFPRIRNSVFCIIYYDMRQPHQMALAPLVDATTTTALDILPEPKTSTVTVPKKGTILALKSNYLYDAVTALNVAAEVPIGKHWSANVEYLFPWWHRGNKYAFQVLSLNMEARYWFARNWQRDALAGHFVGLYGQSGLYDLQWDHALCFQGEFWSAGLSYGYSMPIGRFLNLELSASAGYFTTHYRHYRPSDDYSDLLRDPNRQGRLHYIGPTQLEVSLVLPIRATVKKRKEVVYVY